MKKFILLLYTVFLSLLCFSQTDSTYIGFYQQPFTIKAFLAKDFIFLIEEDGKNETRDYMPNNPVKIGAGISWQNTVISFAYGYGFDFMRDKELGKTRSIDFQYHYYGRKFVFDVFLQQYKGFYVESGNKDKKYELCPDLSIQQYGIFGQYVWNGKKFSYRAAFNQSEKQLRSAGSILIGFGAYNTKIESDSSFVFKEKNNMTNFQFGVSAGYAYTWVISKKWFISGSVTTGIHFGNEKISRLGKEKLEVYPTVFPRFSAGYNRDTWALGFSYISNFVFPAIGDDYTVGLSSGSFQLTYSKRLETVPLIGNKFK